VSKSGIGDLMNGIDEILKSIPKDDIKNKTSQSGELPCPVCKTGTIRWVRVAYNRHIRLGCSTPDCIMMMQ
jgi:hypothetical protein